MKHEESNLVTAWGATKYSHSIDTLSHLNTHKTLAGLLEPPSHPISIHTLSLLHIFQFINLEVALWVDFVGCNAFTTVLEMITLISN